MPHTELQPTKESLFSFLTLAFLGRLHEVVRRAFCAAEPASLYLCSTEQPAAVAMVEARRRRPSWQPTPFDSASQFSAAEAGAACFATAGLSA